MERERGRKETRHAPTDENTHTLEHTEQDTATNRRSKHSFRSTCVVETSSSVPPSKAKEKRRKRRKRKRTSHRQRSTRQEPRNDGIVRILLLPVPLNRTIKAREQSSPNSKVSSDDGRAGFDR
jgi:hypothetical protein